MSKNIDPNTLTWEHFSGSAPDCFEVAGHDDVIFLRNRLAPDPVITGTKQELRDLVEAAKAGQLDKYFA